MPIKLNVKEQLKKTKQMLRVAELPAFQSNPL